MSSTNRGYDRHKCDYYRTPIKDINAFLSAWLSDLQAQGHWLGARPDRAAWLDPCAGGDSTHPMPYPSAISSAFAPDVLDTLDIRDDSPANIHENILDVSHFELFDVIITNPPFDQAEAIISHIIKNAKLGCKVVMLLRLNFLGSKQRMAFFKDHMPTDIYVHPHHISFTDDGVTDSVEYAHFVWTVGENPTHAKLSFV